MYKTIGEWITTDFLEPLELTAENIADYLDIPYEAVEEVFENKYKFDYDEIITLSELFSVSPDYLFEMQQSILEELTFSSENLYNTY